jgi:hypothetical protein
MRAGPLRLGPLRTRAGTNAANNEYLVAQLATAAAWDDIPFDCKLRCLRLAFEAERADRYRARALRFEFRGFIALADRQELLQALEAWLTLRLPTSLQQVEQHAQQQAAIRRRLETRLRAVFDSVFRCSDFFDDELNSDELNLSDEAWAQVAFHVQSLLPEVETPVETPHHRQAAEIRASSADGLHRLRLRFCQLPLDGPPYTCVNIRYYGPQRFHTFDNWHYAAARGGLVQECRGWWTTQPPHPEALDDPRVFEHWRAVSTS